MKRCNVSDYLNVIDETRIKNGMHGQECECDKCVNYDYPEVIDGVIIAIEVMNEIGIPEVAGHFYTPEIHMAILLSSITHVDDPDDGLNDKAIYHFMNNDRAILACMKFLSLYKINIFEMIDESITRITGGK